MFAQRTFDTRRHAAQKRQRRNQQNVAIRTTVRTFQYVREKRWQVIVDILVKARKKDVIQLYIITFTVFCLLLCKGVADLADLADFGTELVPSGRNAQLPCEAL